MGQLEDMAMFVRIVEAGSFTKAAEQLHMAKSALSRRLTNLENNLNVQLLNRTTRKFHLTYEGEHYYQKSLGILDDVNTLNETARDGESNITGRLTLNVPLSFGLMHMSDLLNKFVKTYPDISLHVDFTDRHVDLVEEGYELAIRIGVLQDSSMQAKAIAPIRFILCAGPDYFANHPMPNKPDDLTKHTFIQYGTHNHIRFTGPDGAKVAVTTQSNLVTNSGDFMRDMAINGAGMIVVPTFLVYKAVAKGELIPLLPNYQLGSMRAYAVYPQNRFLSRRCRQLIEFMQEEFGDNPYWDQVIDNIY